MEETWTHPIYEPEASVSSLFGGEGEAMPPATQVTPEPFDPPTICGRPSERAIPVVSFVKMRERDLPVTGFWNKEHIAIEAAKAAQTEASA